MFRRNNVYVIIVSYNSYGNVVVVNECCELLKKNVKGNSKWSSKWLEHSTFN